MKRVTKTVLIVLSTIVILSSCGKDEDAPAPVVAAPVPVTNPGNGTGGAVTVNSSNQFTGVIDGVNYSFVEGSSDINNGVGKNSQTMGNASYDSFLYYDTSGNSIFSIEKGTLSFGGQKPANADFKNYFAVNGYSFSTNAASGFTLDWFDTNQVIWSTSLGTALQTGSTINITEMKEINASGSYYIKTKITFTCTLYDGNGNSKQLTNGVYVGTFENI